MGVDSQPLLILGIAVIVIICLLLIAARQGRPLNLKLSFLKDIFNVDASLGESPIKSVATKSEALIPSKLPQVNVKYGDVIALRHTATNCYLNSRPINYHHSKSSGQQMVTASREIDTNAHWTVEGAYGQPTDIGQPVQVHDVLRLRHRSTHNFLHSHPNHPAPIEHNQQEVSAYGIADSYDNWRLEVEESTTWEIGKRIRLVHVQTNCALHSHASHNNADTGTQQEVTAYSGVDENDFWQVDTILN